MDEASDYASSRNEIVRSAQRLCASGWRAVRSGDWAGGYRDLREAVALDSTFVGAWELLGLLAFAGGSVAEARQAWQNASLADCASPAGEWLQSLQSGDLCEVVRYYNEGVRLAQLGRLDAALSSVSSLADLCPEFLPAVRLEALLRVRIGEASEASTEARSWRRRARFWRSDYLLNQLLQAEREEPAVGNIGVSEKLSRRSVAWFAVAGVIMLAGGIWATNPWHGRLTLPPLRTSQVPTIGGRAAQVEAAQTSPAGRIPSPYPVRVLEVALGGDNDSVATLLEQVGSDTLELPPPVKARVVSILHRSGRHQYSLGRIALAEGRLDEAHERFELATRRGNGAYFADDALYLLMQVEQERGDRGAAREVAKRLLAAHPQSIFANSLTRSIAGAGQ